MANRRRDRGPASAILAALSISALPIVALGAWYIASTQELQVHVATPDVQVAMASSLEIDGSAPISVALTWSEPTRVPYVGEPGLVTSLYVDRGSDISTGTEVIAVNGRVVRAVEGRSPWVLPITSTSSAEDIRELNAFLKSVGFAVNEEGVWTSQTASAVRDYGKQMGAGSAVKSFDPRWVVWVPNQIRVGEIEVEVGFEVPLNGALLVSESQVVRAVVDSSTVPLRLDEAELVIKGDGVRISPEGQVDPTALDLLAAEAEPDSAIFEGVVRRRVPLPVMSLPPTAVITGSDGSACVLQLVDSRRGDPADDSVTPGGEGGNPAVRAISVEVQGGAPGVTYLLVDHSQELEYVVINPIDAYPDRDCS